jgi:cysteine desulfurase
LEHYLDNSATTAVSRLAADKAYEMMVQNYGNPSSLHLKGMQAEKELTLARKCISRALGCSAEELYFTSGGTESNNTAIFGAAQAKRRRGNKLVISFVSVMMVNNETGAVMPVEEIFSACKAKNSEVLCHTDAVQAFGKIKINAKKLGADIISVSAHKVHAPKGCGAIFIKKGVRLVPHQYGGEQESKFRTGTEAMPLIAAFGVACSEFDIDANFEKITALNDYAREKLLNIEGVSLNSPLDALPYVLNISAGRVRSETMLHFLEELSVFVSSGSACAKGKPSHVLSAMGISRERADSAIRISFSKYNTKEDIDALCSGIETGLKVLAHR